VQSGCYSARNVGYQKAFGRQPTLSVEMNNFAALSRANMVQQSQGCSTAMLVGLHYESRW
jgi:hypothetical protein